jgi:hypothetical protein
MKQFKAIPKENNFSKKRFFSLSSALVYQFGSQNKLPEEDFFAFYIRTLCFKQGDQMSL